MSNIETLHIRGFQSHVNSKLNLGPGLNVITGPSDAGKTAILRSVRWVALNDPSGAAFLNESVGETEVSIGLDSGVSITKRRRKGKTSYEVSTVPEPFEKAEVPDEVQAALGIAKQSFGDFEATLNFAFQLEAPFLISETASAGAKVLGKLAGTEVVDLATKSVSKDTYQARQEKTHAERDIQRIEGNLLEYADLDELKRQLEACQFLIAECDGRQRLVADLAIIKTNHGVFSAARDEAQIILMRLAQLPQIEEALREIEKAQQRFERLLDLYSSLSTTTEQVKDLTEQVNLYSQLDYVSKELTAATNSCERAQTYLSLHAGYQKYSQAANEAIEQLDKMNSLSDLQDTVDVASVSHLKLISAQQLMKNASRLQTEINEYTAVLGQYERFDDLKTLTTHIDSTVQKNSILIAALTNYRNAQSHLSATLLLVGKAAHELDNAHMELKEAWGDLTACPLCDQPISGASESGHQTAH